MKPPISDKADRTEKPLLPLPSKCRPGGHGGGIDLEGGTAEFYDDTSISRNEAEQKGGGGYVEAGSLTLTDCTLADNHADMAADGIAYLAGAVVNLINTGPQTKQQA